MTKAPRAGLVKTRLVPPLTPAEAAGLAACFLQDTVAGALRVARDVTVAYTPADGRATLEPLLPAGVHWLEQRGPNLGARLEAAFADASSGGFSPVIALGADSPTLHNAFIETARAALAGGEADIALGPAADGGYYLVALRRPVRGLFENIDWGTPRAYEQTAANAARARLRLLRLPEWYDVDTPSDLARLREELLTDEGSRERAPATCRWLHAHDSRSHAGR
jgi:rSAM/selenodomain-associated transferase 1